MVRPLPARLHNRPEKITQYAERARSSAPTVLAYADCGTYGKLDEFCTANDIPRLPGLHCYDVFAGAEVIANLFDEEPGTYLLTDYLVRTFDNTVMARPGSGQAPRPLAGLLRPLQKSRLAGASAQPQTSKPKPSA